MIKQNNLAILAILVYGLTAYFSVGYYHPDEHHQILEFAIQILGIKPMNEMPWEFAAQMRSTVQPLLAAGAYRLFEIFGTPNPFHFATFLRAVSAILSIVSTLMLIRFIKTKNESPDFQKLIEALCWFLWFNVFVNVRFSSENWSATTFIIAFCLVLGSNRKTTFNLILAGILFGLSFLFRFQTAVMVLGLIAWLAVMDHWKIQKLVVLIGGVIGSIGIGILCDYYVYGDWIISFYNYMEQNLILGKASSFGVEPWWYYLTNGFVAGIPPFSLVYLGAILIVFIRKFRNVLTWIFLPFLLVHFVIGHKEMRFMFPLLAFLPVFIIEALQYTQQKQGQWFSSRWYNGLLRLFLGANFLALVVIVFKPAENNILLFESIYEEYEGNTEICSFVNNPYIGNSELKFYQRDTYTPRYITFDDKIELEDNKTVLLLEHGNKPKVDLPYKRKLVYSSMPEWIKKFNFNNWVERTTFWEVYELEIK